MNVYSLTRARRAYFRSSDEAYAFIGFIPKGESYWVLDPIHVDEGPMTGFWCVVIAPLTGDLREAKEIARTI